MELPRVINGPPPPVPPIQADAPSTAPAAPASGITDSSLDLTMELGNAIEINELRDEFHARTQQFEQQLASNLTNEMHIRLQH